jgi:hypothetical protein
MSDETTKSRRHIEDYLCPRLDRNPWCPSTPGRHGYIFVSAEKEKYLNASPHLCNLFVGLPKRSNKEERFFRYLGVYRASCVDPLSVEEWQSLPFEVRQGYRLISFWADSISTAETGLYSCNQGEEQGSLD